MSPRPDGHHQHDVYYPDEDQTLSTVIVEAVQAQKGERVSKSNLALFDDIDPGALDNLFQTDTASNTIVQFDTDGVTIVLRGNGGVEIDVTSRDSWISFERDLQRG